MVGTTERLVKSIAPPLQRHLPRVVRISVTDADATDSSSDDDGQHGSSKRRCVKRFVSHVNMERRLTTTVTAAASLPAHSRRKKRRREKGGGKTTSSALDSLATSLTCAGVRQGPFRCERNSLAASRIVEEETVVDNDSDGVQLSSPDAVTNLAFPHPEPEEAKSSLAHKPDPKSELGKWPTKSELPGSESNVCSSESFTGPFDSLFSSDFFACDVIVPSVLNLFADPCSDHGQACEFGSLIFDTYSIPSSNDDFGLSISGTTWPADEPMLDIGEIFGSDPLVAI